MKIFISIKFYKDGRNKDLIDTLKDIIKEAQYTPYCFLDEKHIENSREMMKQALEKLSECDVLLVEGSVCSFGAGVEAGYAKTQNKKIIIVAKEGIDVSNTLEGISDYYIVYKDLSHLKQELQQVLTGLN